LVSFDGKTAMPLTAAALAVAGGDTLRVLTMDWSPDGSFIAFAAVSQTGLSAIYRVDVSDGRVTQLTFPSFGGDFSPVVSPDAKDIVFGRTSDGFEIRQVPSGGGAEVLMTPLFNFSSGQAGWDWSPDGSEIVHTTDKWAGGGIVIGKMKRGTTATSYISDLVLVGRAALAGEVQDIQPSWRP